MSEEQKNNSGGNDPKRQAEFRVPPRTWIVWILILGTIVTLMMFRDRVSDTRREELKTYDLRQKIEKNLIAQATVANSQQSAAYDVTGTYFKADADGNKEMVDGKAVEIPFHAKVLLTDSLADQLQNLPGVQVREPNTMLTSILISLLPILLIAGLIWFFFIRQIKMAGKGALSFGKSRARLLAKERNKTTFKDVAGIDEAIDETKELVEFLKDPRKFQRLGGRIPKGVLMVGPPGTGKTLLAKAIAGEADAAFFSISGSDFVEMFVGVGASRVRDMFEQARKNTPCLIFIDEIDAVGRSRGHGLGGGNDEREQTLNALLVEMDGFDTTDGIIIIAATQKGEEAASKNNTLQHPLL